MHVIVSKYKIMQMPYWCLLW